MSLKKLTLKKQVNKLEYNAKLKQYLDVIEKRLNATKQDYECPQKELFDSINYSLLAKGKRIRPIILLAACEMAGGSVDDAVDFAVGLEMIHNSSLIHDDLPAMDNDDLRRGNPTNHIVYGEARAILAGDVLLVRPFEIMSGAVKTGKQLKAMRYIAKSAGSEGMMGGQEIDLKWEGKKAPEETIIILNQLKTGALFKAAVTAGVMIAGGTDEEIACAEKYGDLIGLAFQLVDDLLDLKPEADTGKSKGSDLENGKSTYLSIYGEEKCREMIKKCTIDAKEALSIFGERASFLNKLAEELEERVK